MLRFLIFQHSPVLPIFPNWDQITLLLTFCRHCLKYRFDIDLSEPGTIAETTPIFISLKLLNGVDWYGLVA